MHSDNVLDLAQRLLFLTSSFAFGYLWAATSKKRQVNVDRGTQAARLRVECRTLTVAIASHSVRVWWWRDSVHVLFAVFNFRSKQKYFL